jgi:lysophospholipase L1-like esterase
MKYVALIIRAALGLFLLVVVLEFCSRIDDYVMFGAPMWKPYHWEIIRAEDAIGTRGRPGARYQKWRMNSMGFRGPELREETVRIAAFGASETLGVYEAEDQEYPRQLERKLNSWAGGDVFQVVNVAMVGQRVAEAVRRIPQIVGQVHPKYATLYPAVQYYLRVPRIQQASVIAPPPSAGELDVITPPAEGFELRIMERLRNLFRQAVPTFIQARRWQLEVDRHAATDPVMDRIPEENVGVFQKHVEQFVANTRAAGVEPVLLTHATAFGDRVSESNQYLMTAWRRYYPMLKADGFPDMEKRMNEAIRRVAEHDHVLLIDAARLIPPEPKYFADGGHFTTEGSELMSTLIADTLESLVGPLASSIPQDSKNSRSAN